MYLNKVFLYGFLADEPRQTEKGIRFSVYTARKVKDKLVSEYHNVVSYNKANNEYFLKYAKKSTKVYVEGSIYTNKWTDKDGNQRSKIEIVVSPYEGTIACDYDKESYSVPNAAPAEESAEDGNDNIPF